MHNITIEVSASFGNAISETVPLIAINTRKQLLGMYHVVRQEDSGFYGDLSEFTMTVCVESGEHLLPCELQQLNNLLCFEIVSFIKLHSKMAAKLILIT